MHQRGSALRLATALLLIVAARGQAQTDHNEYRFRPGDRIEVSVLGMADLSRPAVIQPDGRISLPLIGETQAAERTAAELAGDVQRKLSDYVKDPHVDVFLVEPNPRADIARVFVSGEVRTPGMVELPVGSGVYEAVTAAGGLSELADRNSIRLLRRGAAPLTLNAAALERSAATGRTPVMDGDLIVVPRRDDTVTVLGAVAHPGRYPVPPSASVIDAITLAGGLTANADRSRAEQTTAAGKQRTVDLTALYQEGRIAADLPVHGGDTLFVPQARNTISVSGAVARPGVIAVDGPIQLFDLIAQVGGLTTDADPSQAVIASAAGKIDVRNITGYVEGRDRDAAGQLNPGDALYVPTHVLEVTVVGRVTTPGVYPFKPGDRLIYALTRAGGPLPTADLERAILTRADGKEIPLNLQPLIEGGKQNANLPLQAGDVITVPQLSTKVYVFGQVKNPGSFRVAADSHVLDLLSTAGGPTEEADLARVYVVEPSTAGEPVVKTVDLQRLMTRGDQSTNPVVQPGQIVFVPLKKHKFGVPDLLQILVGIDLLKRTRG